MTPQPAKSTRIPTSTIKPTPFPRMSIAPEDIKPVRNVRDKNYKNECAEKIFKFLNCNGYDEPVTLKTFSNPSNKDFQNIYKFIHSFIDSTPFVKFEDDVMNILKMLRYPYTGEITRSQLSAVTPHTWPVLLSMMAWMVELVNKSYEDSDKTQTVESEFFDFLCDGYTRFMEGVEDDDEHGDAFIVRMTSLHSKDAKENENIAKELELLNSELENLKTKFGDLNKLENKKKKINEDLNTLILHERQLETKKLKYISSLEAMIEEIKEAESNLKKLIKIKGELTEKISEQKINPEDIKGMNVEKMELLRELEKLKPEKELLMKRLQSIENKISEQNEENENCLIEVRSISNGITGVSRELVSELEDALAAKKEGLVNYEISISTLEEKISEKTAIFKDLEDQWAQRNAKLQTIGAIYLEKKELSDHSQQKSRNEVDKLDNDLLKLKLENDSAFLKSEKDFSEAKIQLDILKSNISNEKEEIRKAIWEFYNTAGFLIKSLDYIESDIKRIV